MTTGVRSGITGLDRLKIELKVALASHVAYYEDGTNDGMPVSHHG
jgi:hypothetical protein